MNLDLEYINIKYKLLGFNEKQRQEILNGYSNNLHKKQIDLYAKKYFDDAQMKQIRLGLEFGLTEKQIALYTNKKYDCYQMEQIRFGLEFGLTEKQIALYTNEKYDCYQMEKIRFGLENGLIEEQIKLYANEKYNADQMNEIRLGLKSGLSNEQIKLYADEKYDSIQMENMRRQFYLENNLPKEDKIYLNSDDYWTVSLAAKDKNEDYAEKVFRIATKPVFEEVKEEVIKDISKQKGKHRIRFDHYVNQKWKEGLSFITYYTLTEIQEKFKEIETSLNFNNPIIKNNNQSLNENKNHKIKLRF